MESCDSATTQNLSPSSFPSSPFTTGQREQKAPNASELPFVHTDQIISSKKLFLKVSLSTSTETRLTINLGTERGQILGKKQVSPKLLTAEILFFPGFYIDVGLHVLLKNHTTAPSLGIHTTVLTG